MIWIKDAPICGHWKGFTNHQLTKCAKVDIEYEGEKNRMGDNFELLRNKFREYVNKNWLALWLLVVLHNLIGEDSHNHNLAKNLWSGQI